MVDYIRSHKRRAFVFMVAVLSVAGLSVGALATVSAFKSGDEGAASSSVAAAQALLDSGDVIGAGLLLIDTIDAYSDTAAKFEAYASLEALRKVVWNGGLSTEQLLEFESRLPSLEALDTGEARTLIHYFYLTKADLLEDFGLTDFAAETVRTTGAGVVETLRFDGRNGWAILLVPGVFQSAQGVCPEYCASFAESLETYLGETSPCVGALCARYGLIRYYLHEGMNRTRAEHHLAEFTSASHAPYLTAALEDPYLGDSEKVGFLWALGYAQYELGRYEEALNTFQTICAKPALPLGERRWAELAVPSTYLRLYPNDLSIAEAAYEDYLGTHEGREYAQYALLELGNIALERSQPDKADNYFSRVLTEYPNGKAASTASLGIGKSRELRMLKSQAKPR